jgi:anti-sigma factor ChrR (cupin superfamily)
MISEIQQEQASLYVMGALSEEEALSFEAEMDQSAALKAEVASLNNATLALARSVQSLVMPAGCREKLMTHVASLSAPNQDYRIVRNNEDGWQDTPITGFRIKSLAVSTDIGYETLMVEFAPGTYFPAHLHDYSEQFYILSGTVQTEGQVLGPGDLIVGKPGSQHQPLYSHGGCRGLLIRRAA